MRILINQSSRGCDSVTFTSPVHDIAEVFKHVSLGGIYLAEISGGFL